MLRMGRASYTHGSSSNVRHNTPTMKTLAKALIELACFIEFSPDSIIDPDAAVEALEAMSATLQDCTPDERQAFLLECGAESKRWESVASHDAHDLIVFVRNLPQALGIVDEET
jgi:hypothetical protein